jgi:hypothetical protein
LTIAGGGLRIVSMQKILVRAAHRPWPRRPWAAVVACVVVAAGTASAQSLAELAKLEEERRKAITTPSKIYTNEDLRPSPAPARAATQAPAVAPAAPPSPSGVQPPSPSGVPPAAPADPAAAETPAEVEPPDEAAWRQRIQAERDALQRAETFADALQSRINALSTDFAARDDPAQRATIATDRQKALAELDRVQQEILQHTKAIAGIQEEARRAGVPPGWLR